MSMSKLKVLYSSSVCSISRPSSVSHARARKEHVVLAVRCAIFRFSAYFFFFPHPHLAACR